MRNLGRNYSVRFLNDSSRTVVNRFNIFIQKIRNKSDSSISTSLDRVVDNWRAVYFRVQWHINDIYYTFSSDCTKIVISLEVMATSLSCSADFVLGMDLGTTSVKVVLLEAQSNSVTESRSFPTNSDISCTTDTRVGNSYLITAMAVKRHRLYTEKWTSRSIVRKHMVPLICFLKQTFYLLLL